AGICGYMLGNSCFGAAGRAKRRQFFGIRARGAWRQHRAWGVSPRPIAFDSQPAKRAAAATKEIDEETCTDKLLIALSPAPRAG
ncbi:MAG: hypothetical protein ABR568_23750, partial [Pyrinomonadaceae bacterium]